MIANHCAEIKLLSALAVAPLHGTLIAHAAHLHRPPLRSLSCLYLYFYFAHCLVSAMSHRYAPLPNPCASTRTQLDQEQEMAAAFDYSENEDDDRSTSETQPLNPQSSNTHAPRFSLTTPHQFQSSVTSPAPATYDFENDTYDYPPPGSPPPPSSRAFPNSIGNSNGLVPTFESVQAPRSNWFRRAATNILPQRVVARVGLAQQKPSGPVGGGSSNDGVFANVTAKPTAPTRIRDGEYTAPIHHRYLLTGE
jgi:hypothetical protein